jgi:aspartate dehydrogenase
VSERRVGLIGFGAISASVVEHLPSGWAVTGVLVRPGRQHGVREVIGSAAVVTTAEELVATEPEVVLECAGQEALAAFAEPVLEAGCDLIAISTGALAEDGLRARLAAVRERGGGRLIVAAGAIGGLDALGALRQQGISRVTYTSIKPPHAWLGTPAEEVIDLRALTEPATFFRGSAREAARQFPKNANLAITVALAAGALEETVVTLVADPDATANIGIVEADAPAGQLRLDLRGPAAADNPRTSAVTALSLVHELERRSSPLVI